MLEDMCHEQATFGEPCHSDIYCAPVLQGKTPRAPRGVLSARTQSLLRCDRSTISSPHMAFFTIKDLKHHAIVAKQAGEQGDTPQSGNHRGISHAERRCHEVVHVDDDVAIFVLDRLEGQEAVSSPRQDFAESGSDAFDDAKVELGLREELGPFGEDQAGFGAGDFEGDAVGEQSFVLSRGGRIHGRPCMFSRRSRGGRLLCHLLTLGPAFRMVESMRH